MGRYVGVVAVLLLLVATATAASVDRHERSLGDKVKRVKREATTCESKYANLSGHTLCLTDNENATQVELNDTMKQHILHLHNYYRCIVEPTAADMMLLVWDEMLERTAKKWAMQCPMNHDTNRNEPDWNFLKTGQNIGMGHKSWDIMLNRFFTESTRKNYTYGEDFRDVGYGHYYQMVTARTVRVGCGQAYCPYTSFKRFRVCNYVLRMDASRPPYENGTSCSACPDTCSANYSLCDCGGKLCFNGGTLDPSTCECKCTVLYAGENCSEHNCADPDFSSCQTYAYSDCGVNGMVRDEAMCPHLCKLCPPCNGKTCDNGGTLNEDTCQCQCTADYKGEFCELNCTYCENGGVGDNSTCGCDCPNPFYGDMCEKECNATVDCNNNGEPVTDDGTCKCNCTAGFVEPDCETDVGCEDEYYCSSFQQANYCTPGHVYYQCMSSYFVAMCPKCCHGRTNCPV